MQSAVRSLRSAAILAIFLLGNACAQTLELAAAQLSVRLSAVLNVKTGMNLGIENVSSLSAAEAAKAGDAIRSELTRAGVQFDTNSLALIQISIAENARGFLLIAQEGTNVVMVPWSGPPVLSTADRAIMGKTLVLEHAAQILDISLTNNDTEFWVLEPARLVHFTNALADRSTPLPLARPISRDARGT